MKYKIIEYRNLGDYFLCEDESGKKIKLDLFTDCSYKGFGNVTRASGDYLKKYKSIEGKTIEVEKITQYVPLYFATNVKLLKEMNEWRNKEEITN